LLAPADLGDDLSHCWTMQMSANPYDLLPYKSAPVEWTAPERLAISSALHGGPIPALRGYRLLELGSADGANLIPMAYYRRHASFVGVDSANSQVSLARERTSAVRLTNLDFVCADFGDANKVLTGRFDYIIAHGVCSWIAIDMLETLLLLCARRLEPNGLLYLNYNAKPGWSFRGMVRDFLINATAGYEDLTARGNAAQQIAAKAAAAVESSQSPYSQLLANEFKFVYEGELSYVAHEFLSSENHAFWNSEFLSMAAHHGLSYVADADFNYPSGRVDEELYQRLLDHQIIGRTVRDTADLLCYRQLHSPIFRQAAYDHASVPVDLHELWIASCLEGRDVAHGWFVHSSGYEVEVKDEGVGRALRSLHAVWPQGIRVAALFDDIERLRDDLLALHRNGLIELRLTESDNVSPERLNDLELRINGRAYVTNAYHMREFRLHPVASATAEEAVVRCGP
jgi:ubiquinone/menaquinone biosynthesis C-methylase UbiE